MARLTLPRPSASLPIHRPYSRRTHVLRVCSDGINIVLVRRQLLKWGRANFRNYPWRYESDPWLALLAEFLLQRTRASQVEAVYAEVRERFPTPQDLVEAGAHGISEITRRLGLHWRGALLLEVARTVAESGGTPPETRSDLLMLGGIGTYTAAAWLSLHRGKREPIIDSNVTRWLSRMTGLPYNRDPRHLSWVKELAERLTPRRAFRDYNYAVLDFSMSICAPRIPHCDRCPLSKNCRYARDSK